MKIVAMPKVSVFCSNEQEKVEFMDEVFPQYLKGAYSRRHEYGNKRIEVDGNIVEVDIRAMHLDSLDNEKVSEEYKEEFNSMMIGAHSVVVYDPKEEIREFEVGDKTVKDSDIFVQLARAAQFRFEPNPFPQLKETVFYIGFSDYAYTQRTWRDPFKPTHFFYTPYIKEANTVLQTIAELAAGKLKIMEDVRGGMIDYQIVPATVK